MKNLLYKEFNLVLNFSIVLLLVLFGLFPLIPTYPKAASLFYIAAIYPMIFLGANKGTMTNDVYFSLTLPTSRNRIVGARFLFLTILQFVLLLIMTITTAIGYQIEQIIYASSNQPIPVTGLSWPGFMALIGFALISFAILDLIFMPLYYKTAKKFTMPYLLGMIAYAILITLFEIVLPIANQGFKDLFIAWDPLVQPLTLLFGLLAYIVIRYLSYILTSRNFKKVDF